MMTDESIEKKNVYQILKNNWVYYIHLHETKEWNFESYIKIVNINTIEDAILLNDEINYDLIKKSMMFLMKDGIKPMWEDDYNKDGGCFSYKVLNKDIERVWKEVYFNILGENITNKNGINDNINGITLSPKKRFCILKIWMKDCSIKDPDIFISIDNLSNEGCLFKKHNPEF